MNYRSLVKKALRSFGMDVVRYPSPENIRRRQTLRQFNIDTLFDIGANSGQFAKYVRQLDYSGGIFSFEPTSEAFGELSKNAAKDENWHVFNMALGSEPGETEINIAGNSYSSSILEMSEVHEKAAPDSRFLKKEKVVVETLDRFSEKHSSDFGNIYVKIDTQGFEYEVIKGGMSTIRRAKCVQLEVGLVELYKGEKLMRQMLDFFEEMNYGVYLIEPEFFDKESGRMLQVDITFYNKDFKL